MKKQSKNLHKKVRVLVMSKPLSAEKAMKFRDSMKDLWQGKFVFSGEYSVNGRGTKYPMFLVVRDAPDNINELKDYELIVENGEIAERVPTLN